MILGELQRKSWHLAFAGVCVLTSIGAGRPAQAGVMQLTSPADLASSDTALPFPGQPGLAINSSSVAFSAGGETVGFANTSGNGFEVDQANYNYGSTAFSNGTKLLGSGGFQGPGGPLTITFSQAVGEFGFNIEDFDNLAYKVSFAAYNAGTLLGTFTSSGCDGCSSGPSYLSFEGLRASDGSLITSIVVTDDAGNNMMVGNFAFGLPGIPVSVPEPPSLALLAAGAAGIMAVGRRRRSGAA